MYYLLFGIAYLFSLLPFWVLYGFSDVCCILLFYVIRYRRQIVQQNFEKAYPNLSEKELKTLIRKFYQSFCDQWIETLKLMSLPVATIKKRFTGNWDVFDEAAARGNGSVVAMLGHQFNWEWANLATPLHFKGQYAGVYLPVEAKVIEKLLLYIRSRTRALLISSKHLGGGLKKLKNKKHILAFIADQSPPTSETSGWHQFMNRETPFLIGPEKLARHQQSAVVFVGLKKIRRGHYIMQAEVICHNAAEKEEGEIREQYVRFLEKKLKGQPPNWMWTHRRWKKSPN